MAPLAGCQPSSAQAPQCAQAARLRGGQHPHGNWYQGAPLRRYKLAPRTGPAGSICFGGLATSAAGAAWHADPRQLDGTVASSSGGMCMSRARAIVASVLFLTAVVVPGLAGADGTWLDGPVTNWNRPGV